MTLCVVPENRVVLESLVRGTSRHTTNSIRLEELLLGNDFDAMQALFHAFFASIPYEWYTSNDIDRYEGFYASVFYFLLLLRRAGPRHHGGGQHEPRAPGYSGAVRRRRVLVRVQGGEDGGRGCGVVQLKERRYAEKYRDTGEPIHLVAVEFSRETRNVVAFEVEAG